MTRPLAESETLSWPKDESAPVRITLQCVRLNAAYTITVYQRTLRVEDLCGSYPTEQEARGAGRLLAELFVMEVAK